ncbi:ABC transporter permease [Pseudolysinimonas sp.]|uniref:ABC transporter permease n=1 Tax=Pseudolysinimonas sp. TaxID=2680009 RepID=UPI003F80CB3E
MSVVLVILGRNLRIYFRDRLNVFFSLLGALVLFLLYMLFLRQLQIDSLTSQFPGSSRGRIAAFVDCWMFAGVVGVTTVTTGLGGFSTFVDDASTSRFRDFMVSPVRRGQLVLGYLSSSAAVAIALSSIVLALSFGYLLVVDQLVLPVGDLAAVVGVMALSCLGFAALSALAVSFVHTPGAFAALSTIAGTTLGFLAGSYVPIGLFPSGVQSVINALPFGQAASLLRRAFAQSALDGLTGGRAEAETHLASIFGLSAAVGDWQVPTGYIVGVLAVMAVGFTVLAGLRMRRRVR